MAGGVEQRTAGIGVRRYPVNIFINDVDEMVKALIQKFADDTKVARVVESDADAKELQEDIDRM